MRGVEPMLIQLILCWMLGWSAAAFAVCGWDKRCARRGRRRVPERVLWTLSIAGGAAGMLLGMGCFRHKTRHPAFVGGVPAVLLAQLTLLAGLVLRR